MIPYQLIRPFLFRMSAENAHRLSLQAMRQIERLGYLNPLQQRLPANKCTVMGLQFNNPVGLAAGFDKDGDCIDGLAALGFGFIEIGTVTPLPQAGNSKPRLFRIPKAKAIINRMGFNSKGVDYLCKQIKKAKYRGILGINIGKNLATPVDNALDDYRICLRRVYPLADYIVVNISSPNTPGLRTLQYGDSLDDLLDGLNADRQKLANQHKRIVPIALKIAPDLDHLQVQQIADTLIKHNLDAVIATNTTVSRYGVEDFEYGREQGGLSGRPLFDKSTQIVFELKQCLKDTIPIIACGGIFSADDAKTKFEAGASLVQLYSGLIYRGPELIKEIISMHRG